MRFILLFLLCTVGFVHGSFAQENIHKETQQHWFLDAQLTYTYALAQTQINYFPIRDFPSSNLGLQLRGGLNIEQEVAFTFAVSAFYDGYFYPRLLRCGNGLRFDDADDPWYDFALLRTQYLAVSPLVGMNFNIFKIFSVGLETGVNLAFRTETHRYYYFERYAHLPQITLGENGEIYRDRAVTNVLSTEFLLAPNIQFRAPLFDNFYCSGGIRYFILQNRLNAGVGFGWEF